MSGFRLEYNQRRHLVLVEETGERHEDVYPVCAFPLSDPGRAISLCDQTGREVLFLDSLADATPDQRKILEAELAHREFVPIIRRIVNTPALTEPTTFQVETDRGVTTFEIEGEEGIHRRDTHRVSIIDTHGIRYEIEDLRRLDPHSRRVLERFI